MFMFICLCLDAKDAMQCCSVGLAKENFGDIYVWMFDTEVV